jgi:uncharacterized protein (UPF0305 family)
MPRKSKEFERRVVREKFNSTYINVYIGNLIESLCDIREQGEKQGYSNISIEINDAYLGDLYIDELEIHGERKENDEEYNKRIRKLEKRKEREKKTKEAKEAKDRILYEKLKKRFEEK